MSQHRSPDQDAPERASWNWRLWVFLVTCIGLVAIVIVSISGADDENLDERGDTAAPRDDLPGEELTEERQASAGDQTGVDPPSDESISGVDIGAANTGPTAYLDPVLGRRLAYDDLEPSGSVTTSHDGQIIEKFDIDGGIEIAHDDVTVRAVRIRNDGGRYSISYNSESDPEGATIEYVEIDGRGNIESIGVLLDRFTLRRSNIYDQRVGVQFRDGSVIEENYVHSQATEHGSHNTAMSIHGGSDVVVRDNNLEGSTSAALSLYPRLNALEDILVTGNLLNGGSYCTYAGYTDNHEHREENRGIRYIGNVFGTALHPDCGKYGPVHGFNDEQPGNEWRDNTWLHTGEPVDG